MIISEMQRNFTYIFSELKNVEGYSDCESAFLILFNFYFKCKFESSFHGKVAGPTGKIPLLVAWQGMCYSEGYKVRNVM